MSIKEKIKSSPKLKALALFLLQPRHEYRPRWWVRNIWSPLVHKRGKAAVIRGSVRRDLFPYNQFSLGNNALIEDFCTLNNAVGNVLIGDRTLVGMSNTIIGPVTLGNDILIAQNVVLSGLNHIYEDITKSVREQSQITKTIVVEDACWIGANVVVVPGVTIGKHSVIAAGSIVTKDIPPFSVALGNPAKVVKQYNFDTKVWEKVSDK